MTEHPMNFDAESVRAILEGRMTETRRVVTPSRSTIDGHDWSRVEFLFGYKDWLPMFRFGDARVDNSMEDAWTPGRVWQYLHVPFDVEESVHRWRPVWGLDDLLWVREVWCPSVDGIAYKATDRLPPGGHWRPPNSMSRRSSRLTLRVDAVRAKRVIAKVTDTLVWVWVVEFEVVERPGTTA